jgi:hypothetical protein
MEKPRPASGPRLSPVTAQVHSIEVQFGGRRAGQESRPRPYARCRVDGRLSSPKSPVERPHRHGRLSKSWEQADEKCSPALGGERGDQVS